MTSAAIALLVVVAPFAAAAAVHAARLTTDASVNVDGVIVTFTGEPPAGWVVAERPTGVSVSSQSETDQRELMWSATVVLDARPDPNPYPSLEAFTAAMDPTVLDDDQTDVFDVQSGTTALLGLEWWYVSWRQVTYTGFAGDENPSEFSRTLEVQRYHHLGDGRALGFDESLVVYTRSAGEAPRLEAEMQQVASQFGVSLPGTPVEPTEAPTATAPSETGPIGPPTEPEEPVEPLEPEEPVEPEDTTAATTEDDDTWRTVIGALAAVAAAAAALAALRPPDTDDESPDRVIGHVLQLSTDRLDVSPTTSARLEARVWAVRATGAMEPDGGASVAITPPAGVDTQPRQGTGSVTTAVWQTDPSAPPGVLTVTAGSTGGGTRAAVQVRTETPTRLVVTADPTGGGPIRADGRDRRWVCARLELSPSEAAAADVEATHASIRFRDPGSESWIDLGQPDLRADGCWIPVAVSSPHPDRLVKPPPGVTVTALATVGEAEVTGHVRLPVAPLPELDCSPDEVRFTIGSGASTTVRAWVDHTGDAAWDLSWRWREGDDTLADVEIRATGPAAADVVLTEAATIGRAGDATQLQHPQTSSRLVVVATPDDGGDPLERYISVVAAGEGLFIDPTGLDPAGRLHLDGTGGGRPAELDVVVVAAEDSGTVSTDSTLADLVEWEPAGDQTGIGHRALLVPGFTHEVVGHRGVSTPSTVHRLTMRRLVPADGSALPATLRVWVPDRDDRFERLMPVLIHSADGTPFSPLWDLERERCLHLIETLVPRSEQARLYELVEQRGRTFGAEGLFELRRRIYIYGRDALVAESEQWMTQSWYLQQAEDVLDWVSWCGDIAFAAVSGPIMLTPAGIALGFLKPLLVSAIEVWRDGGDLWDWAGRQLGFLAGVIEGQATDIDMLNRRLGGNNKAKAWAVFVAYRLARNLYDDPNLSVVAAAEKTLYDIRDEALIQFLRMVGNREAARTATARARRPDARARAQQTADRMRAEARRDGRVSTQSIADLMTDPDAARQLRSNHPDAWQHYEAARSRLRVEHDARLTAELRRRPEFAGRKVRVETVGTEGGIDRDVRVVVEVDDPRTPGRTMELEVDHRTWADDSNRIFAEQTGGPADPAARAEWARQRQHLAGDASIGEASIDMADQAWWTDPSTGRRQRVQVPPRVDLAMEGRATLLDPDGLGRTFEAKVLDSSRAGAHDGYVQAGKASRTLRGVRDGYVKMGYDVGALDPKVERGMRIVERAADGPMTPSSANKALQAEGLGDLQSFTTKLSGQFAALGYATKP